MCKTIFKTNSCLKTLQQETLEQTLCDKLFSTHAGVTKCFEALRQKNVGKTCLQISQNSYQNVMSVKERKTQWDI